MFKNLLRTETKAAGNPVGRAIASASGANPGQGLGIAGQWDFDSATQQGYERVVWIFRCVDVIASNQARLNINIVKGLQSRGKVSGNAEGKELVENEDLWRLLNFRANPYETAQQFRYRLSAQLLLSRRGAFIEISKGEGGKTELHLLPPGATSPIPDAKKFVSGYEVTNADYSKTTLKPDDVMWVKMKPHPADPYQQMTPLVAAGIEADTDYLARVFNRNFLSNDGRPGMLISIDGGPTGLSQEDAEIIKQRFSGGPAMAGQTTVIEGSGMNVQDMSSTPRDTQWDQLLAASKERLLMSFGVPESVMGNASGRTFDNADAERENFWQDTMIGHCDTIAAALDPLTGDSKDEVICVHNYDEVDVLQRMAANRREEWRGEVASGLRSVDSYLEQCGREPYGVAASEVLYLPSGAIVGKDEKQVQEVMEMLQAVGGGAPQGTPSPDLSAKPLSRGISQTLRQFDNQISARANSLLKSFDRTEETKGENFINGEVITGLITEKKHHPYLDLRYKMEGQIEGAFAAFDHSQSRTIPQRLMHTKSRKGTRHWDGEGAGVNPIDPMYAVEVDRWIQEAVDSVEAAIDQNMKKEADKAAKELVDFGVLSAMVDEGLVDGKGRGFEKVFPDRTAGETALAEVKRRVMEVVRVSVSQQSRRVADKIREMDSDNATLEEINAAVKELIGNRSTWRGFLAANVTTAAIEGARAEVMEKAGSKILKRWNAVGDERTRDSHNAVDQTTIPVGERFRVGKGKLMFPSDPTGPVEEVINCRCYLSYEPNYDAL